MHLDTASGCTSEVWKPHHVRVASKLRRTHSRTPGSGPGSTRDRHPQKRDPVLPDRCDKTSKTIVIENVLLWRVSDVKGRCMKTMPSTCTGKSAGARKKLHNQAVTQPRGNVRVNVGPRNGMTNCAAVSTQTTQGSRRGLVAHCWRLIATGRRRM